MRRLQTAIERSRADLGERWLNHYLTSPVWRFALSGGICGARPAIGVMMPSVDQVGRYFPLCMAAVLPADACPAVIAATEADWFWKAECTVLASLEDGFEIKVLDQAVRDIGLPASCVSNGANRVESTPPMPMARPPSARRRAAGIFAARRIGRRRPASCLSRSA